MSQLTHTEFGLFSKPLVQTEILARPWIQVYPKNKEIGKSREIEFIIDRSEFEFTELGPSFLEITMTFQKDENNAIALQASPINLFPVTIFDHAEFEIEGINVADRSDLFAYRAYLQTLLGYERSVKNTTLQLMGWHEDTAGRFNEIAGTDNTGFATRLAIWGTDKTLTFRTPLFFDIAQQPRAIIPQVAMRLKLYVGDQEFYLMSTAAQGNTHKLKISDCVLHVQRLLPDPGMHEAVLKTLQQENAYYPLVKCVMKVCCF